MPLPIMAWTMRRACSFQKKDAPTKQRDKQQKELPIGAAMFENISYKTTSLTLLIALVYAVFYMFYSDVVLNNIDNIL